MPDLVPVDVEGVIVEAGVPHQPVPLVPALGDVVAIVLVEVFAEVAYHCCYIEEKKAKTQSFIMI